MLNFTHYHLIALQRGVMASQSLEDIMSTCGVDPTIASQLVQDGWTTQSFACAALDLESFDRLWQDLLLIRNSVCFKRHQCVQRSKCVNPLCSQWRLRQPIIGVRIR